MNLDDVFRMAEASGIFEFMNDMNINAQNEAIATFADMVARRERDECIQQIEYRFIHA